MMKLPIGKTFLSDYRIESDGTLTEVETRYMLRKMQDGEYGIEDCSTVDDPGISLAIAANENIRWVSENHQVFDRYKSLVTAALARVNEQVLCDTCIANGVSIDPFENPGSACDMCRNTYQSNQWFYNQIVG